jgi:hypothetical protein
MKRFMTTAALLMLLAACSWVTLTPEGKKVRVLSASEVAQCQKVGRTTANTKAVVAGFERSEERVREELEFLARNAAPDLNGDTVVPVAEPKDGRQTFDVYRCVK